MGLPRLRHLVRWTALMGLLAAVAPRAVSSASDAGSADSLDGLWISDGYGYFAEIRGGKLDLSEITPYSCIASAKLTLAPAPADPRGRRFVGKDGASAVFVAPGPTADSEWFHDPEAASRVLFRRASARPEACARPIPNDSPTNFEIFAWTFGAHHGFLAHRGVNWPAVTESFRARVTAATSPEELFDIFRAMIEPLHDAHTFIVARDIHKVFNGRKPGTGALTDADKKRTLEIVETRYLEGQLRSFCHGHVRYGRLKGRAGYIRIDAFSRYAADADFDAGARALDDALDETDARFLRGLVIDVRLNQGGADPYGVQIACRLTANPYVAFVKRARNDPENPERWTDPQTVAVQPSARPHFLGKVVEHIGPDTVSAGETFTMALMGRSPRVPRVGEDTQGVYSDVLERSLPNGWKLGLPNEVFLTAKGEHFEARGVPPDIRLDVFPAGDLSAGRDGGLEKAIEILGTGAIRRRS